MATPNEEHERICFNCESFLPAVFMEPTEFGICLNDEAFDPYIEELLENANFACCQDLIDEKRFPGEREACADFRDGMAEAIEIDDDSVLGRAFKRAIKNGQFDMETFEQAFVDEQFKSINWKDVPVEQHAEQLQSPNREERAAAISHLTFLIIQKNKSAFKVLLDFLKDLPPPETIEDVHFKIDLLRRLEHGNRTASLRRVLINELYRTPSNNTTRQWISKIFEFLEQYPLEEVRAPLEEMLHDKRFSHRLKRRIRSILSPPSMFGPFDVDA